MNSDTLQELHRHREFHIRQINTFNLSGSIAVVGVVVSILLKGGDSTSQLDRGLAWFLAILIGLSAFLLVTGIPCHWIWHAGQVRKVDGYIFQCLTRDGFRLNDIAPIDLAGLGKDWHPAYLLPGLGVTGMGVAGVVYIIAMLTP